MIDLTPLDVRNKRGDFKKLMRGYDPQEVDVFLELVAERLEGLVRENLQLKERTQTLQQQVTSQLGREQAVQDALVTAQELRADIKAQSQREADHVIREAEAEVRRMIAEAEAEVRSRLRGVERRFEGAHDAFLELERRRSRFLKDFRALLERELDVVQVEEGRTPLDERAIDLDLGPSMGPAESSPGEVGTEGPISPDSLEAFGAGEPPAAPSATPPPLPESVRSGADSTLDVPEMAQTLPAPDADSGPSAVGTAAAAASAVAASSPEAAATPTPTAGNPTGGAADLPPSELSASFEAAAMAEAESQIVEVKVADGDKLSDVPRLEEVLAEAGADAAEGPQEAVSPAPESAEEIAPPPVGRKDERTLLLHFDQDEPER